MSVDDCKIKCNERDDCLAFEYGVSYGGSGNYNPKDCQLQSSINKVGCDATHHNLDLYVKKGMKYSELLSHGQFYSVKYIFILQYKSISHNIW